MLPATCYLLLATCYLNPTQPNLWPAGLRQEGCTAAATQRGKDVRRVTLSLNPPANIMQGYGISLSGSVQVSWPQAPISLGIPALPPRGRTRDGGVGSIGLCAQSLVVTVDSS